MYLLIWLVQDVTMFRCVCVTNQSLSSVMVSNDVCDEIESHSVSLCIWYLCDKLTSNTNLNYRVSKVINESLCQ